MASKRLIGALLLCAAPFLPAQVRAMDPPPVEPSGSLPRLAAYHAVYDLTLTGAKGVGAPTSARGRIAFDFSGSDCEGYVEKVQQVTELHGAEGPPKFSTVRSATFEAGDGKHFRFEIETKTNGEPDEKVDGEARKAPGAPLSVKLVNPEPHQANLAGDALFPSEHLRRVLAAAKAGGLFLEARVYDGSEDGVKILETTTTIGKAVSGAVVEKAAQVEELKNARRWPVSISYFEADAKDQSPLYRMSFELYENGVSRALKLDYGDFALSGEMTELALAPTTAACAN